VVLGVSKDPVSAQAKFKKKYELPFPLLSDADGKVCDAYGVLKDKSMYGKIFKGIERSTFVIDAEGRVAKIFRAVKVAGHALAVLEEL
jgi:peroxiredoxin Q/BCP